MALRDCQVAGKSCQAVGTVSWGKPQADTAGKLVGMVTNQQIGTIGSQVLRVMLVTTAYWMQFTD